jgi:hypothetical protein
MSVLWWWIPSVFAYPGKTAFLLHVWRITFLGIVFLVDRFWFFSSASFGTYRPLQACKVFAKKYTDDLMGFPSNVTWHFFWLFLWFSLPWTLYSLTIICHRDYLFMLKFIQDPLNWMSIALPNFEVLSYYFMESVLYAFSLFF